MDYWKICIEEAFEESAIKATDEQIKNVITWVEGAHENYGLATGEDVTHANFISDEKRELDALKKEQEKQRLYLLETSPCQACTTTLREMPKGTIFYMNIKYRDVSVILQCEFVKIKNGWVYGLIKSCSTNRVYVEVGEVVKARANRCYVEKVNVTTHWFKTLDNVV